MKNVRRFGGSAVRIGVVLAFSASAASAASPVFSPATPATTTHPSLIVRPVAPPSAPAPGPDRPSRADLIRQLDAIQKQLQDIKDNPVGGGGALGPLGATCAEARAHMRWSSLPCAPDMPRE